MGVNKRGKLNKPLIIAFLTSGAGIVILSILYFSGQIFFNPRVDITPALAPPEENLSAKNSNLSKIKIGEKEVNAKIAATAAERQKGLSGRESLPEDQGMLFVYGNLVMPVFWMKDMKFPIDIIWISEGRVVGFEKNVPNPPLGINDSELKRYSPTQPVTAVLEVNAGFVGKNNIKAGDLVEFYSLEPSL